MIARFTAERMKTHGKKSIFNLGGEETLTHFGKSLAEIERLDDDPRSDDEEDEEGSDSEDAPLKPKAVETESENSDSDEVTAPQFLKR